MSILIRITRFVPAFFLIAFAILVAFSREPGRTLQSSGQSVMPRLEKEIEAFDSPDVAEEFYRLKRAPVGEQAIPVERYLMADEQMKLMLQYSSATNTFGPTSMGVWAQLGPGNIGGRTRALVVDPLNSSLMYAGGVAGGIWKSTNGGASWDSKGDLLPNLAVCSIAIDPANSSVLYAGTGEGFFNFDAVRGAGIFKSTDSGETWLQLNSTNRDKFYYVNDIVVPHTGHVYAATATGVWRSTDAGTNFSRVLNPGVNLGCLDLAIRTDQSTDYVFASCGSLAQATVYRNTDAGGSGAWTAVYSEPGMGRTSLAIAQFSQNTIYALASNQSSYGLVAVLRSTDSGNTWSARVRSTDPTKLNTVLLSNPIWAYYPECYNQQHAPGNQGWYDNVIAVDPADPNRIWVGGVDLFRSDDGGANWGIASHWWASTGASQYAHADQHAIVFHPQYNGTTNKTMFVAGDGGIFRTNDARAATGFGEFAVCNQVSSVVWTALNYNYGVTQFYHGVPYPNGATYFGGTQDNGTVRGSDSAGVNGWSRIHEGDGGYVAVDRTNTSVLYAEELYLSFQKTGDGGVNWFDATSGITELSTSFLPIAPFLMDPSSSQRLWMGGNKIWRTINGASSWSQASAPLSSGEAVSAIAVASSNPNQVLVGTQLGRIYRTSSGLTSNASTVWSSITLRNYGDYISGLTFDPLSANIAYATVSSFNLFSSDHHVFKSTDAGATWINIDGSGNTGIPDIPVHCIVVDPNGSSKLYVGTDLGVFVSLDGGASWNRENTGFANAVTESLAFNTVGVTTTLFAFTHGRGVWRVPVSAAPPPPSGVDYVSDLNLNVITNGWGPLERDQSNGEQPAGDGRTITLNGVPFAKGLGAAANSEVRVSLNGGYTTFLADVGLDDEMDPYGVVGSIVFQVWADGVKIYDSGVMNTVTATKTINVSVAGKNELRLIVTDGGDNNWYDHADWAGARLVRASAPPPPAFDYVSDLNFTVITNGWGPLERDQSNGEQPAGDGRTITLNGVQYAKGLGASAISEVRVTLNGGYTTFVSDVGLDDEMDPYGVVGSIVFQVWADGVKIYDSGVMNTVTATKSINVSVAGKNELRLIVTDGGDNNWYDHADWAGARLVRGSAPPPPPPAFDYVSDLNFTVITNGWGPVERDQSLGEQPAGDGRTITLNGVQYAKGLGAAAISEVRVTLNGGYTTFVSDAGLDDEMDPYGVVGSIVFQVWADKVKIYDSGVMNTVTATRTINVSVAGKNELRLIVTDGGDNNWYDHADWAGARLVR